MIETNQLRCFIAVAEELHFNRAALRLNMTQPPLSRQIQLLETRIDCKLFIRTSRSVVLTEAGKSFLNDARRILRLLENAQKAAKDISLGRSGILRCGFTAVTANKFLPQLISNMKADIPNSTLDLKEMVSLRQITALDSGDLDVGLLRPLVDPRKYQDRLVSRERLMLAIPAGHPLGAREFARWRDLDGVDFIMYDSVESKYFHDLLTVFLARKHVRPNIVQRLTQIHSMLSLVRAGVGVAVVPESARILDVADVEYREFADQSSPYAELFIVWRETNQNPLIPIVVDIAEALLEQASTQPVQPR
ncbi:MAG: LysR family transcriptional regulator [Hyphomicrobiales bacterium]|nr:MAG: LysR family transcriptional regulator [Hyphomicrobiales bacterium]